MNRKRRVSIFDAGYQKNAEQSSAAAAEVFDPADFALQDYHDNLVDDEDTISISLHSVSVSSSTTASTTSIIPSPENLMLNKEVSYSTTRSSRSLLLLVD